MGGVDGKIYSQFASKKDDTQISGKYYHITGQNNIDDFNGSDDGLEQEYLEDEEYSIEEHSSTKEFIKSKTHNLFGFL